MRTAGETQSWNNLTDLSAVLAALNRQERLLQQLLQRSRLGFQERTQFIFCNPTNCQGYGWYHLEGDPPQTIGIEASSLCGFVRGLELVNATRKGREVEKLQISIEADRKYVLEAGVASHFSRGFLSSIVQIPFATLQNFPVSIAPFLGDEALFCRVSLNGQHIKSTYDLKADDRKAHLDAIEMLSRITDRFSPPPPPTPKPISSPAARRVKAARTSAGMDARSIIALLGSHGVTHPDELDLPGLERLLEDIRKYGQSAEKAPISSQS